MRPRATSGRKGRPSASQIVELRRHIIDVAWLLFIKHGFDGVTINDIAVAGRLSNRTIYSRFENKEALFVAAYEQYISEAANGLSRIDTDAPFEQWLRSFAENFLRFMTSEGTRFLEGRGVPDTNLFPEVSRQTERIYELVLSNLNAAFLKTVSSADIAVDDPATALRCWFDMLIGHVRIKHRGEPGSFDIEAYLEEWLDTLVEMCLRLLKR